MIVVNWAWGRVAEQKNKLFRKNKIVKMRWKTRKNWCKSNENENNQIQFFFWYYLGLVWLSECTRYIRSMNYSLRVYPLDKLRCRYARGEWSLKTWFVKQWSINISMLRGAWVLTWWSTWIVAINIVGTLCWCYGWSRALPMIFSNTNPQHNHLTLIIVAQCTTYDQLKRACRSRRVGCTRCGALCTPWAKS